MAAPAFGVLQSCVQDEPSAEDAAAQFQEFPAEAGLMVEALNAVGQIVQVGLGPLQPRPRSHDAGIVPEGAANEVRGLARHATASPMVFLRVTGVIFIALTLMKSISFTVGIE